MKTDAATTQGPTLTAEDERGIELYLDNLYLGSSAQKLKPVHKLQFLSVCKAYGLNPLKKQIHAWPVKYGKPDENFVVVIAYENFIQRAEKSSFLTHWGTEFSAAKTLDGRPDSACTITIERRDWARPFVHTVYLSEYRQDNVFWRNKPRTMLKKVTVAQGFRLCFSLECGHMPYIAEELDYRPQNVTVPTISRNPPAQAVQEPASTLALTDATPNMLESSEGSEAPQNGPEDLRISNSSSDENTKAPHVDEQETPKEIPEQPKPPAQPDLFAATPEKDAEEARKGHISGLKSLFIGEESSEVLAFFRSKKYLAEDADFDDMDAEHAEKVAKNASQCLNIFRAWVVGYRRKQNGGSDA